jgi:nitroreductase
VLVGLTSIHWRESWKYGERAFRYCHHDVGHAIGAIAIAAAGLGWEARLLEGVTDSELARLLGIDGQSGIEAEHADCLLAIYPHPQGVPQDQPQNAVFPMDQQRAFTIRDVARAPLCPTEWLGVPNRLSNDHRHWPVIDDVAAATRKTEPPCADFWDNSRASNSPLAVGDSTLALRTIVQQRRSAVAFDGSYQHHPRSLFPDPAQGIAWQGTRPICDVTLAAPHRFAAVCPSGGGHGTRPLRSPARSTAQRRPCNS